MKELTVNSREEGQRFDKYLKKCLPDAPGSFVYKMLRKKNITLNGARADGSEKLSAGDVVRLFLSDDTYSKFGGRAFAASGSGSTEPDSRRKEDAERRRRTECDPLPGGCGILYEDDDILIVNKPAGLLSQGDRTGEPSLAGLLDARDRELYAGERTGTFKVSPANRLDRNTSGIVLCGKSIRGMQFLSGVIRLRDLKKEYLVLAAGAFSINGTREVFYTKDEARNCVRLSETPSKESGKMITGFTPLAVNGSCSLIRVHLLTGKPHQIRAHLAYLGHPVCGDPKYGDRKVNRAMKEEFRISRQMLHAASIRFPEELPHPGFEYLAGRSFDAPMPEDMVRAVKGMGLIS